MEKFVVILSFFILSTVGIEAQDVPGKVKSQIEQDHEAIMKRLQKKETLRRQIAQLYEENGGKGVVMSYKVIDGDTVYVDKLPPVFVFDAPRGKKAKGRNWRQYRKLVYNFRVVYPYALQARQIIYEADSTLAVSNFTSKEREEYINNYQKALFKQFEKPLRKLTISQGKLLLKLIDRELGRTSFYIIREYRGRLSAGFWQTVARIFGHNLKKPYDKFGEDRPVEDLIVLWQHGAFDYLYYSLFYK